MKKPGTRQARTRRAPTTTTEAESAPGQSGAAASEQPARVPRRNPDGSKRRPRPRKNARARRLARDAQKASGKIGQPGLVFDADEFETIRTLKGMGKTDDQIADYLGISRTSFYEHKAKNPEFAEAIERGKTLVEVKLDHALVREAAGGSLGHIQYAHRVFKLHPHAWSTKVEHTGADGGPIATETKGPMPLEEIAARLRGFMDRQESTIANAPTTPAGDAAA